MATKAASKAPAKTSDQPTKKPVPPNARKLQERQEELQRKFLTEGLDFSPFTLDAGDGVEWTFNPDPQPRDTAVLSQAMKALQLDDATPDAMEEAFSNLVDALRPLIADDKQREEFPLPRYGSQALMWFAMRASAGRDGFPTE